MQRLKIVTNNRTNSVRYYAFESYKDKWVRVSESDFIEYESLYNRKKLYIVAQPHAKKHLTVQHTDCY